MAGSIEELARYRYERADYEDFFVVSKIDAEEQLVKAEQFLKYVRKYLTDNNIL